MAVRSGARSCTYSIAGLDADLEERSGSEIWGVR